MLKEKEYNIYILGAGFSKPAKLPLGNELFEYVLKEIKKPTIWHNHTINLYENFLKDDIERFINYKASVSGELLNENEINFEEFLSYLDIEHYFGLLGGDTWSNEGNESQVLIRNYISKVIFDKQNEIKESNFNLYELFVEKLRPEDIVITFNYDTILEKVLDKKKIKYRLFPVRYDEVNENEGILNTISDEVIILKMHGSIDWFSIKNYREQFKHHLKHKNYYPPSMSIFDNRIKFQPEKIIDEPYLSDSGLQDIYKVKNLGDYFSISSLMTEAPLILSPSMNKILYINPLLDFWWGFGHNGSFSKNIVIIGFSMPKHDAYLTQCIYSVINNYQNSSYQEKYEKSKIILVDYRTDELGICDYKNTYNFANQKKAVFYFNGFNEEVLNYF